MDLVVHRERRANDGRIAVKLIHPELVAQHDDGWRADRLLARTEGSAEQRLDAEHVEETVGDYAGLHSQRVAVAVELEGHAVVLGHAAHRLQVVIEVGHLDHRIPVELRLGGLRREVDEPVSASDRETPEQHAVHHAEDRGARANADGERHDRGQGEYRRLAKRAYGVPRVLHQRLEQHPWAHVAHFLLHLFHAARLEERGPSCGLGGHPLLDLLGRDQLDVRIELVVQLPILPLAVEHGTLMR